MSLSKLNCYGCKYRGDVPGDAHSCCKHPFVIGREYKELYSFMVNGESCLNIKYSEHGFKSGWVMFPLNFDPIWITNCDGFTTIDTFNLRR